MILSSAVKSGKQGNTNQPLGFVPVIGGTCQDEIVPTNPKEAMENQKAALASSNGALATQSPVCVSRPAPEALC